MTKSTKRILSFVLALTLLFCTVAALPSSASAAINWTIQRTGTSAYLTRSFGGGTFTASLSRGTSSATAVSSHTTTIYLGARAGMYYQVPASSSGTMYTSGPVVENASTRVEASASVSSAYIAKIAYGRHGSIYNGPELVVETKN